MLDQSFSAHNFEIIYGIESRKGNIDIGYMPKEYQQIITTTKDIRKSLFSLRHKKNITTEETELLESLELEFAKETKLKNVTLLGYLEELSNQVNLHNFRFSFDKYKTNNDKEVFTIKKGDIAQLFAIKQLQYNIRRTFKVKQANRHSILSNIKAFLNSKIPLYIIRTDISNFYESIPHNKLLPLIADNTLLSHKSKAYILSIIQEYEFKKNTELVKPSIGLPRGIGISSFLSELYMRNIDAEIANKREVMFYARYVDDIFIVLSSLSVEKSLDDYYKKLSSFFGGFGLFLKQPNDDSNKCYLIDFATKEKTIKEMDYLGYRLYMNRVSGNLTTAFGLSHKKQNRYKEKIDNAIAHFETLSRHNILQAYKDLFDSLNYISGNYKLFKYKSNVKVGLFFSNDLLDKIEVLDELTKYLHNHSITPYIGLKDCVNLKIKLSKRVKEINFMERWKKRKMFSFKFQRINEIEKWL